MVNLLGHMAWIIDYSPAQILVWKAGKMYDEPFCYNSERCFNYSISKLPNSMFK